MVGILARVPRVGQGKSRLAASVGAEMAAALSRAFLLDIVRELGHDDRWSCALFVEPPDECDEAAALTGIADARPQSGGSIGSRMAAAASSLADGGARAVVLAGSDVPLLEASDVAQALGTLGRHDMVFGPAGDGGYYLVGLGPAVLETGLGTLFTDAIPWSTSVVLEESERIARGLGWSVAQIRPLSDVDTAHDLASLRRELAARPGTAVHTREALRALDEQMG
jgi:rSAM/selenodomain-associated transferase 1